VSRYENDRVMPSVEVIVKMARAYPMSLDYLLLDDAPRRALEMPVSKLAERVLRVGPLAEVLELPGVLAYGESAEQALAHVQALALRVLADRLEHGEGPRGPISVRFETSAAA